MPKATLIFKLPEEHREHQRALKAEAFARVIWEMDGYLRCKLKYEELLEPTREAFQAARDRLREIMEECDVTTEDVL